jgi:hypothetical protein
MATKLFLGDILGLDRFDEIGYNIRVIKVAACLPQVFRRTLLPSTFILPPYGVRIVSRAAIGRDSAVPKRLRASLLNTSGHLADYGYNS